MKEQPGASLFFIEDFARSYIQPFDHHEQVKEEHLAEAFRAYAGLPPFPAYFELVDLVQRAHIELKALPLRSPNLAGANVWSANKRPAIYIDPHLRRSYAETTIGHELREVIEQAFKRVKPSFVGLNTHDNRTMNPRSDRFASNLLMPRAPMQELLAMLGFDFFSFSYATGRSLPSVLVRAQDVCAARHGWGITAGVWLFQRPWFEPPAPDSRGYAAVSHRAHLRGFSMSRKGGATARLARQRFPTLGTPLRDCDIAATAARSGVPAVQECGGFDLLGDHDFVLIAEPLFDAKGIVRRVLVAAVRKDFEPSVAGWLKRLNDQAATCQIA